MFCVTRIANFSKDIAMEYAKVLTRKACLSVKAVNVLGYNVIQVGSVHDFVARRGRRMDDQMCQCSMCVGWDGRCKGWYCRLVIV